MTSVRLTVNPSSVRDEKPTCPICGRAVKLNELVRSAHHVLGCHGCYSRQEVEEAAERQQDRHMNRPSIMVTRRIA